MAYISAKKLFKEGITYDEFLIKPADMLAFDTSEVNLESRLTKEITLKVPFVSAPMDTVSEIDMLIAMALVGGIGSGHYNKPFEEQLKQYESVKRFESGFIENPVTLSPQHKISDVIKIRREKGFSVVPITENGKPDGKLVGIITKDDYGAEKHQDIEIKKRMTSKENLDYAVWNEIRGKNPLSRANEILLESHRSTLPIIDNKGNLMYLITRNDIEKNMQFTNATKDNKKRLRVLAAVESKSKERFDKIDELVKIGVDGVIIDYAIPHKNAVEFGRKIKQKYPSLQVISSNMVTEDQISRTKDIFDGYRIGMGASPICITQAMLGTGRAQPNAVYETAKKAREYNIPVIADGSISKPGHLGRAIAIGASTIMMGTMLAGTKESPGEYRINEHGIRVKTHRGMGSEEAMKKGSAIRYGSENSRRVAQGVTAEVTDKGSVYDLLLDLEAALKQSLQYYGHRNIKSLHNALYAGKIKFEKLSMAAQYQSGYYGLYAVKQPKLLK